MAISGSVVGREIQATLKPGSTWGTEASGGNGLYVEDLGMSYDQGLDKVEVNTGIWGREVDQGSITASANYKQPLMFNDLRGVAGVLGADGYSAPAEVNAGKGDYQHVILPSGDNFGDFFTLAVKKSSSIIQTIPSVKFTGFTLSGAASPNRLQMSYDTIGSSVENNSTVITDSHFSSITFLDDTRAYFRNLKVWVNDQGSTALATADRIDNLITSFEFSCKRNQASDYTNTSGLNVEEPVEDGSMEIMCNLEFRTQDAVGSALFDDLVNGTAKKLKFEVEGPAASSATGTVANALIRFECPHVRVQSDNFPNVSGAGRQTNSLTLTILGATSSTDAPGMTFTEPFRFTAINNQSTKALA